MSGCAEVTPHAASTQRCDAHTTTMTPPSTVTATDSDGNTFKLLKTPGSESTQTIRFKSMYVKGGALLPASHVLPWRLPFYRSWRGCCMSRS